MTEKKLRSSGKGRGWNFKKGAKDAPTTDELRERASKGGKVKTPKGFSSRDVVEKALKTRGIVK